MTSLTRRQALTGGLVAGGLVLVGCSHKGSSTPTPVPSAPASSGTSASASASADTRPRWPLTGELVRNPADLKHPAVAVKVPNLQREYPQLGIQDADIVFVEPNGPSYTRLCAVFHTTFPASGVNPVRSIRPVDVPLLAPMRLILASTGAQPWVLKYVAHFDEYVESHPYMSMTGTNAYGIDRSRVYSLNGQYYYDKAALAYPANLAKLAKRFKSAPHRYFDYALAGQKASSDAGKKASHVAIPYGSNYDMTYTYDTKSKRYLRSEPWGPHVTSDGKRISADNVLVLRAHWHMAKIWEGGGTVDPVVDIIKQSGPLHYFHGGKYVTGTWKKDAVQDRWKLTTSDGKPLLLAPGTTWVELPQKTATIAVLA